MSASKPTSGCDSFRPMARRATTRCPFPPPTVEDKFLRLRLLGGCRASAGNPCHRAVGKSRKGLALAPRTDTAPADFGWGHDRRTRRTKNRDRRGTREPTGQLRQTAVTSHWLVCYFDFATSLRKSAFVLKFVSRSSSRSSDATVLDLPSSPTASSTRRILVVAPTFLELISSSS